MQTKWLRETNDTDVNIDALEADNVKGFQKCTIPKQNGWDTGEIHPQQQ